VCLTAIVHIATKAHHDAEVTDAIDKLARIGCTNDNQCADHILSAGLLEDQRGNPRRALMYYRRARERYPFRDDILALRASSAARLGLHAEALDEFSELSRRHPEQPKWPADAAHERQLLLQGPLQGQGGPLQGLHAP